MAQLFRNAGYEVVDYEEFADVYVVNTCTVTNMSDRKSRQILRRAKEINPSSILVCCGCYVQVSSKELEKFSEIDILLGTNERKDIVKYVEEYMTEKVVDVADIMKLQPYLEWGETAYTNHARAELKIQDGCDRFCSYCIIPYARGPVRSRNLDDIICEAKKLVESGIKEIVLTGIHISSYGKDFKTGIGLIDVLEKVNAVEGIERIRIGSLEPIIITENFVSRIKQLDKLCNHFHLSLQSGCDETLQRMNRRYTTEDFRRIVKLLRENIPEVSLTTDIIVGFPGETDKEFEKTFTFLKEIAFSKMHVFKYSPRKGTKAISFPNQVDGNTKNTRSDILISLSNENEKKFASQYIGKSIKVLFETESEGHTTNYIKVVDKVSMQKPGSIVDVEIQGFEKDYLY